MNSMKFAFISVLFLSLVLSACKKEETTSSGNTWTLDATVFLGSEFPVTASADIQTSGTNFTAQISTITISGAPEVHHITLSGTVNNGVYTITNQNFELTVGTATEEIKVNTLVFSIIGNSLEGSGTIAVYQGGTLIEDGTVDVSGIRN
jgi:hypothetical protein